MTLGDRLDRAFGLRAAGTTPLREVAAGGTTFLTMSYILLVNPAILGRAIVLDAPDAFGQLLAATALAAAVGTAVMGLWARYPVALAPGMGLNAYFAFTVVLGQKVPWPTALGAVFLSGVLCFALSLTGLRRALVHALPLELRLATGAGIGLFLALLGLKEAGIVIASPETLVMVGDLTAPGPLLTLVGLVVTAAVLARKVGAAILVGIGAVTALAVGLDLPVYQGKPFAGFPQGLVAAPAWPKDLFLHLDVAAAWDMGLVAVVFTFAFVDLFDTAGTLVGLGRKARLADDKGELPRASKAFAADASGTVFGALLGTSSTTSYIESAAGIEAGGRTGLTALAVSALFLASLAFWPLAAAVPAVATAPALVVIGAGMLEGVGEIDWPDPLTAVPSFLVLVGMPLTFSIANGIALGILSWVALALVSGRWARVHPIMALLAALLAVRYAWLAA